MSKSTPLLQGSKPDGGDAQTAIPYPNITGLSELAAWRRVMGDPARVPVVVPVELTVSIDRLTLRCEGARLPTGLPAILKRLSSGRREPKGKRRSAPGCRHLSLLERGEYVGRNLDPEARAYHRAMATGRWA